MQRVTISLDDETAAMLDSFVTGHGYANRSEAVRDLIRETTSIAATSDGQRGCIGVLSYVYDHERRDLAQRLTHAHHDHHVASLATLHLHLDRATCLEAAVMRGTATQLRAIADRVIAERGVRYGDLRLVADAHLGGSDPHADTAVPHHHHDHPDRHERDAHGHRHHDDDGEEVR